MKQATGQPKFSNPNDLAASDLMRAAMANANVDELADNGTDEPSRLGLGHASTAMLAAKKRGANESRDGGRDDRDDEAPAIANLDDFKKKETNVDVDALIKRDIMVCAANIAFIIVIIIIIISYDSRAQPKKVGGNDGKKESSSSSSSSDSKDALADGEDAAEGSDGWRARDKDAARALMNSGVKRSEIKALTREEDKLADKIEVITHINCMSTCYHG